MIMRIKYLVSATALLLFSNVALAGLAAPLPVQIDFDARTAIGDMYTARTSENAFEYIGCGVRYGAAGPIFGFCQAGLGEAAEQQFTCITTEPAIIEAIHAISAFSFIIFAWDVDGNCTRIGNSTQSFYLPLFKDKKK